MDEVFDELEALNLQGAAICVVVNVTDGLGSKAENVTGLRACFIDYDRGHLEASIGLQEHARVKTANGEHLYFRLRPGERIDQFEATQSALIRALGTDSSIKNVNRVMRVPGFYHCKGEPVMVTFETFDAPEYSLAEIVEACKRSSSSKVAVALEDPGYIDEPAKSAQYLKAERWLRVQAPQAVENAHGNDQAYKVFCCLKTDFAPTDAEVEPLAQWYNDNKCDPSFPPEQLDTILANTQRYAKDRRGNALNKITNGVAGPGALDQHFEDDYSDALVATDFDEDPSNAGHLVERGILVSKSFSGIEPDGLRVPIGYYVDDQSIMKIPQSHGKRGHVYPKMVASSPIFIVKKMQNRTTNICYVRLACQDDGEWRFDTFELETVMTARTLVGLSKFGIPVNSLSARDLIAYFVAFQTENRELLRTETVVSQMGWHRSGAHSVFVMGDTCFLP